MEQVKLPFRADIVGSFLRPERLKKQEKTSNQAYYLLPHSNKSRMKKLKINSRTKSCRLTGYYGWGISPFVVAPPTSFGD